MRTVALPGATSRAMRSRVVEELGTQVRAVGPHHRANDWIHRSLAKESGITEWLEHLTVKQWLNVNFVQGSIIKRH